MTRRLIFLIGMVLVTIVLIVAQRILQNKVDALAAKRALPVYGQLPEFELIERSGQTFGSKNLKGKVWIANFIFTRCAGPCPTMSLNMSQLQNLIPNSSEVRLVSFSVDPEYDTVEVLNEYAKRFNADPNRWVFLTGKYESIRQLARESFKMTMEKSEAERAPENNDTGVVHSSHFILVDRKGCIRKYYDNPNAEILSQIAKDIDFLLNEK